MALISSLLAKPGTARNENSRGQMAIQLSQCALRLALARIFLRAIARRHGLAFGGTRFVNNAFEKPSYRGIREWTGIRTLSVLQHFLLPLRLIQGKMRGLL